MENRKKNIFYYIGKIFRPFDTVRKIIVNILFWGIVILLIIGLFSGEKIKLSGESNALALQIQGTVVEQLSGNPISQAVDGLSGYQVEETLLWDILEAIDRAAVDSRIGSIFLDLRYFQGAGLGALSEIRDALVEFKDQGKSIIAYSDYFEQGAYYLASAADKIYADPMGDFLIRGFSVYNWYYGDGIDRLGVDINYFHAGKYKSFGEVYTRSSMSDEAREANGKWTGDLWDHYVNIVSRARSMKPEQFNRFIDNYVEILEQAGGNSVRAAVRVALLDGLMNRSEMEDEMIDLCGYSFERDSFKQIYYEDYLALERDLFLVEENKIAVINGSGTIYHGYEDPGNIGGDSMAELIDQVQYDSAFKALVLRVDSGGGSAFASEIIRRKLQRLRDSGVPVVVSMGSVAASGGYWISTASDEIWAQPTTITGSIGVFSLVPTFQEPLNEYLGVNVDGVGTTWLAGSMTGDRELDPKVGEIYQQSVDFIYRQFLGYVSQARGMTVDEVDAVAQGRVWSGIQARELGLVDNLGGLDKAVEAAARLAGLGEGEYGTEFVAQEIPLGDQMLTSFLENIKWDKWGIRIFEENLLKKLRNLEELNDPSGVYALTELNLK
jgi:protease-4